MLCKSIIIIYFSWFHHLIIQDQLSITYSAACGKKGETSLPCHAPIPSWNNTKRTPLPLLYKLIKQTDLIKGGSGNETMIAELQGLASKFLPKCSIKSYLIPNVQCPIPKTHPHAYSRSAKLQRFFTMIAYQYCTRMSSSTSATATATLISVLVWESPTSRWWAGCRLSVHLLRPRRFVAISLVSSFHTTRTH